jgi:integrase
MSVHEYQKGKWHVEVYWPDGVRWRRRMPNKPSAEKLDAQIRIAKLEGTWAEFRGELEQRRYKLESFTEFWKRYYRDYVKIHNRSPITKKSRASHLIEFFGSKSIGQIRPADITKYVKSRKGKVADATINKELKLLQHIFTWAVRKEFLISNPVASVDRLAEPRRRTHSRKGIPRPKRILPRYISETMEVIRVMRPDLYPIFLFVRETGCRIGEALRLEWSWIDWEERVVYLEIPKTGEEEIVPLTRPLHEALQALPPLPGCAYVFYNPATKTRYKDLRRIWHKVRDLTGYGWMEIHDLRRFRGTELWQSELTPQEVASLLGHSSVRTTQRHYVQEDKLRTAKKVLKWEN